MISKRYKYHIEVRDMKKRLTNLIILSMVLSAVSLSSTMTAQAETYEGKSGEKTVISINADNATLNNGNPNYKQFGNASATGKGSIAIGNSTQATGENSTSLGVSAKASASGAVAVGDSAKSTATGAVSKTLPGRIAFLWDVVQKPSIQTVWQWGRIQRLVKKTM